MDAVTSSYLVGLGISKIDISERLFCPLSVCGEPTSALPYAPGRQRNLMLDLVNGADVLSDENAAKSMVGASAVSMQLKANLKRF